MAHQDRDLLPMGSTFDVVRRGYDRGQVDEHLDRLDADLRILAADRDAAMARAAELAKQMENQRAQLIANERELARLAAMPTSMEGMSERLQRMLRLAQEEATEIRAQAEADAAELMARAEADGGSLRDRYQELIAELDERRATMESEHRSLVEKAKSESARMVADATERARQLEAESAARRRHIEEDFDIAMTARRAEAMRALVEQETASKAEAQRRVAAATAEADRRLREATEMAARLVAEAQAESDGLRALRDRILAQLRQVQSVLAGATETIQPLADERPPAGAAERTVHIPAEGSSDTTRPAIDANTAEQPAEGRSDETTRVLRTGRAAPVAANRR